MEPCPRKPREVFTDGVQAGLVLALRQLAGDGGLAYLLREHEYFPGVFFPVASSWSPPRAAENEAQADLLHLSDYACLAYVFLEHEKRNGTNPEIQPMPSRFLEIVREWRIEALFLSQDRFDCVEEQENMILVNRDPWTRAIYDLNSDDGDAHYRLVIGGPFSPTGVLTTPLREALASMIFETWPIVARRHLTAIVKKDELLKQLAEYFEDRSPAPPYTNAPIFSIWADGEPRYGLNQLAFNCFLARQIAEFSVRTVPLFHNLKEIDNSFRHNTMPTGDIFWGHTLARTPHVLKMLERAPSQERKQYTSGYYTDLGIDILAQVLQRTDLCQDITTSRVLELLCRFCDDYVYCSRESAPDHEGEWIFWIRANHLHVKDRHPSEHKEEKRAASGEPASLQAFARLWEISVPLPCDVLNAVWGVRLVDNQPQLLVPLFMRFNDKGKESFCEQFALETANAAPPRWAVPELSIEEPAGKHPRIKLGVWPEMGVLDKPTLSRRIERGSRPVLQDAARAPAVKRTLAEKLLDHLRQADSFASGGDLGHDWKGSTLQTDAAVQHLAKFYGLAMESRPDIVEPFFRAMRQFWDPLAPRSLFICPLSLLLVFRLAQLSDPEFADSALFRDWLEKSCPRLLERTGAALDEPRVCIGKPPLQADPWWAELASFLDKIRLHRDTGRPLLGSISFVDTETSFRLSVRLEGFDHQKFAASVRGERPRGVTTPKFIELVTALGRDQAASLVRPDAFPAGLSVYMIRANDAATDLIIAAEPGLR